MTAATIKIEKSGINSSTKNMANQTSDERRIRNRPRLRTLEPTTGERHASWLELFFDLVYVLAVSQVASILTQHSDLGGMLKFIALFVPVWWSWIGYTYYADRFETEEYVYRILTFAGMLAVIGLSLTLENSFSAQGDAPFIVCYVLVRFVLIVLYVRSSYYIPLVRAFNLQFIVGLGISSALLLISLLFEPSARYAIWAIALLLELATPFLNLKETRSLPIDRSHIPERLGLFTIIVLGEAVISTANGAGRVEWKAQTITAAAMGFAMAAAIWWINFDFVEDSAVKGRALFPRFVYLYGHLFIVSSIVAVGIGVEHAIKESNEAHLHLPTLALLAVGVAVYLAATTIIRLLASVCNMFYVRVAEIIVSLSLLYIGQFLPPLIVLALFLGLLVANVVLESFYGDVKTSNNTPVLEYCEHAGEMTTFQPRSEDGCEECRKNNYKWVHLRLCLTCGHVGCCDTSVHKHATKHFHSSDHPIIASLEPGEHWAWCYPDERFVPLPKRVGHKQNEVIK